VSRGKAVHLLSEPAAGAQISSPPRPTGTPSAPPASNQAGATRVVDLKGEGPELVAFALLRYLAQIEQQQVQSGVAHRSFDRRWLLDAYAECLEAVKGNRHVG
jgi:hypothetical protein